MVNRDYRKEIGVKVSRKSVPKAAAIAVFVAVGAVITFSVTRILDASHKRHAGKQPATAAAPAD